MTLHDLIAQYKTLSYKLNELWPLKDNQQKTFARVMKIVEELGELSDEILTSMNLQRGTKLKKFSQQNVEDEFADVMASLILLGIQLDIDIEKVMERKIKFTQERFELER